MSYNLRIMIYKNGRSIYDTHCQSVSQLKDGTVVVDFGAYDKRFEKSEYDYYFCSVDYNA